MLKGKKLRTERKDTGCRGGGGDEKTNIGKREKNGRERGQS